LIEDASVIMAYGRRYGLIGRNGTGEGSASPELHHLTLQMPNSLVEAKLPGVV